MAITRRRAIELGAAAAIAPGAALAAERQSPAPAPAAVAAPTRARVALAVSTYSYWHFRTEKYPIDKVIEHAAAVGFEGVEILHRQMVDETPAYVNGLKRAAFRAGLSLPMLSIHQDFVHPDAAERQKHVDHTKHCLELAASLGIPVVRLNSGRWKTIKSFDELMKVKGDEPPLPGHTDNDAFQWCTAAIEACLPTAEKEGVMLALENHWGLTTRPENLLRIYQGVRSPWFGVNLDTGNFPGDPYAGIELHRAARRHRPGQDLLRRRRVVHARPRLPAHRRAPAQGRLPRLGLARDGRQGRPAHGGPEELRGATQGVRMTPPMPPPRGARGARR